MAQLRAVVDQLLTDVSMRVPARGCVAEQIFPVIKSAQTTGKLVGYGKDHLRIQNSVVAGRGKYRRVEGSTFSTQTYDIESHGLESVVTEEDYRNKVQPFDAEADEVTGLQSMLILEKEKATADVLTNTSVVTNNTTLAGTSQLSDYTNSDPIAQIKAARIAMINAAGVAPNKVVMDSVVFETLRYHPKLFAALGYNNQNPGGLSLQQMQQVFQVETILVSEARYNSSKQGQADVLAPVWGKAIVFLYAPQAAAKYQQSAGYQILLDGSSPRQVFKQAAFNPPGSTEILCRDQYDQFIADVSCMYLIAAAIA